jgi:hypothetical protein
MTSPMNADGDRVMSGDGDRVGGDARWPTSVAAWGRC